MTVASSKVEVRLMIIPIKLMHPSIHYLGPYNCYKSALELTAAIEEGRFAEKRVGRGGATASACLGHPRADEASILL